MRTALSATAALLMLGTAASAADLRPMPYQPPIAALPTWTGFYLGANLGGGFGQDRIDVGVVGAPAFASVNNAFQGVIGGGQIGYNWQFNSFVAGLETDFQGSSLKSSLTAPCAPAICAPLRLSAAYSQSVPGSGPCVGIGCTEHLDDLRDRRLRLCVGRNQRHRHRGPARRNVQFERNQKWLDRRRRHRGRGRSAMGVKAEYLVDLGSVRNTWNFPASPWRSGGLQRLTSR